MECYNSTGKARKLLLRCFDAKVLTIHLPNKKLIARKVVCFYEKKWNCEKILNLLIIDFSEKTSLDTLLDKIRTANILPGSETEGEITVLCNRIADELKKEKSDNNIIISLYEKLHHEVTFLSFD